MNTRFDPPLVRGKTAVLAINEDEPSINVCIHVKAKSPKDIHSPEIQEFIQMQLNDVIAYLKMEGYISKIKNYTFHTGVMFHPSLY